MEMSQEDFNSVMLDVFQTEKKGYNLNTNNCADAAIQLVRASGNDVPRTEGSWSFSLPGYSFSGRGVNPGDLGEDIRTNPNTNKAPGVAKIR